MRCLVLLAVICGLWGSVSSSSILIVDSKENAYLQTGDVVNLTPGSLSNLLAGLTGLYPSTAVTADDSIKISEVVKPSPFKKPRAYVLLNIAGVASVDKLVFGGRTVRSAHLVAQDTTASLLKAFTSMKEANKDITPVSLGGPVIKDCDAACVDKHLRVCVAKALDAEYVACDVPLQGRIELPDGSVFDLKVKDNMLLALELATTFAHLKAETKKIKEGTQDLELLESTFTSLQSFHQKHGEASPEFQAAKGLVLSFIEMMVQELDAACDGDVVYQVTCLGTEIEPYVMDSLKAVSARHLLQGTDDTSEEDARRFSVKATSYGTFILLLYFSLAAVYCMCYMPFKQDSLLYVKTKSD
jgi:hypothetical protein